MNDPSCGVRRFDGRPRDEVGPDRRSPWRCRLEDLHRRTPLPLYSFGGLSTGVLSEGMSGVWEVRDGGSHRRMEPNPPTDPSCRPVPSRTRPESAGETDTRDLGVPDTHGLRHPSFFSTDSRSRPVVHQPHVTPGADVYPRLGRTDSVIFEYVGGVCVRLYVCERV